MGIHMSAHIHTVCNSITSLTCTLLQKVETLLNVSAHIDVHIQNTGQCSLIGNYVMDIIHTFIYSDTCFIFHTHVYLYIYLVLVYAWIATHPGVNAIKHHMVLCKHKPMCANNDLHEAGNFRREEAFCSQYTHHSEPGRQCTLWQHREYYGERGWIPLPP